MFGKRSRGYGRKRSAKPNLISRIVIVRSATFHSQEQIFLLPEINTFRDRCRAARINCKLQKRPQTGECENVDVAIEIETLDSNQEIARSAGERIIVIGHTRIAQISRSDFADHFICAHG